MPHSFVSGERCRITVDLPLHQPFTDTFGEEKVIAQVVLGFTNRELHVVRLNPVDDEPMYINLPEVQHPQAWPDWLSDLITEHRPHPFGTGERLAAALLAALRQEAKERAAHTDVSERALLNRVDGLDPIDTLSALDALNLLTGSLLRAAKDVLTHLDRPTYGSASKQQD